MGTRQVSTRGAFFGKFFYMRSKAAPEQNRSKNVFEQNRTNPKSLILWRASQNKSANI